jgi:hypothetical protein
MSTMQGTLAASNRRQSGLQGRTVKPLAGNLMKPDSGVVETVVGRHDPRPRADPLKIFGILRWRKDAKLLCSW